MIVVIEESPEVITFENTRSGDTFHAWLREGTAEWIVTRQGSAEGFGKADVWGRAVPDDRSWRGYAGNLPDTEGVTFKSRDDAFGWITNDRADPGT